MKRPAPVDQRLWHLSRFEYFEVRLSDGFLVGSEYFQEKVFFRPNRVVICKCLDAHHLDGSGPTLEVDNITHVCTAERERFCARCCDPSLRGARQ